MTTGARQGELFALSWEDVDLDNGIISINKSLEEVAGKLRIKTPKTKAGKRIVSIPQGTVSVLEDHREWLKHEGRYRDDLVYPARRGGYMRKSNFLRRHWEPMLERLGMPHVHFHSLRHFHASVLVDGGESIKTVQSRMGHANTQTTLNIYAKILDPAQRGAADKLQGRFFSDEN